MKAICLSVAGLCFSVASYGAPTVLSFSELKTLEQLWAAHPEDAELTTRLGQNYGFDAIGITGFTAQGMVAGWAKTPAELELQAYAKTALAGCRNGVVIGTAGGTAWTYGPMSRDVDIRSYAQGLIERAIELQPGDSRWLGQRIQITITRERFSFWKPLSAAVAYPMAKADLDGMSGGARSWPVRSVAMLAIRAGKLDDAQRFAEEMLSGKESSSFDPGNFVFTGNTVAGLIALKRGDVGTAKADLLKSGTTIGAPNLNSFGPNMTLAAALMDAGERDVVLQFFEECRRFWKMGGAKLDEWSGDVKAGRKPAFGANLMY